MTWNQQHADRTLAELGGSISIISDADGHAEPYFSWSACDVCGSNLGGDRWDCDAYADGEIVHVSACVDCVAYAYNGEVPADV